VVSSIIGILEDLRRKGLDSENLSSPHTGSISNSIVDDDALCDEEEGSSSGELEEDGEEKKGEKIHLNGFVSSVAFLE
jgi:hypothetical protein